MIVYCSQIW